MATKISSIDRERLKHINYLMDEFYDKLSTIYEHLVDREIEECNCEILRLIKDLQALLYSMKDEL